MKRNLFFFLLFGAAILFFPACDKDTINQEVDCSLCFPVPPDTGFVRPEITINIENPSVAVAVWEGRVEDNKLIIRDTFSIPEPRIAVLTGKSYSLTATYLRGNNTIIVVDGDRLEVKKAVGQCGGTCYVIVGGFYDLRLK